jgi:hypothetical protein
MAPQDAPAPLSAQEGQPGSPFETYRAALDERRRRRLADGCIEVLEADSEWFLARVDGTAGAPVRLAVNLGRDPRPLRGAAARPILSSAPELRERPLDTLPGRTSVWLPAEGGEGRTGGGR